MDDGWRWANTSALRVRYGGSMALELFATGTTFTVRDSEVVPDGDPDTVYTVRYFTSDDADRLRKQATGPKKWNPETREMDEGEFDGMGYALSVLDHIIADWEGVVSGGSPVACTLEHKRILPAIRREKLLKLAQDNVRVKAAAQSATFRDFEDGR